MDSGVAMKRTAHIEPVWIEGRLLRRRPEALKLAVLTTAQREEIVHLPCSRCVAEEEGRWAVPAWWAHQHHLPTLPYDPPTRLVDADLSAIEARVLANLATAAPAYGVPPDEALSRASAAFRSLRATVFSGRVGADGSLRLEPATPTGRLLEDFQQIFGDQ